MIPVNQNMVCNHCKNLLEETYRSGILLRVLNITSLLVRLADKQLATSIGVKYRGLCFQERKLLLFLHTLQYEVPWGTSPYS